MAAGSWTLCETKPERVLYANLGKPCCPCVVYRIHNNGPAAVFVGSGAIHLDPQEDGDISGPKIDVALTKKPVLCPPGSNTIEQMATGTYELLCCCTGCGCETTSATSTPTKTTIPIAAPLTVQVEVLLPPFKIGGMLNFQWRVQGASPQALFTFTTEIFVPDMQNKQFPVDTGQQGQFFHSPLTTRWPSIVFPSTAVVGALHNNFLIVHVTEPATGATGSANSIPFDITP